MILDGNPRAGGRDLAIHLMKQENERVEIIEMRGFASDNLRDAFVESFAISKGTRCTQHLFSMSINPPTGADIGDSDYRYAADRTEEKLKLTGQPRTIVRHWKRDDDGVLRPHAHAVWCRIDVERMKAVALPFHKLKLRDVSRDLHMEYGLRMPPGLLNSRDRNPANFTLEQWQQCKRAKRNVHDVQDDFRDAWSISDSPVSFAHALSERGYVLAKGNRGHVAVDHKGEKFAVSRYVGLKAKEIRAKLGEPDTLPTVEIAQQLAAQRVSQRLSELRNEQRAEIELSRAFEKTQTNRLAARDAKVDARLRSRQHHREIIEEKIRQSRIRKGLPGFWDWLTGAKKKTLTKNQEEAMQARERDREELVAVRNRQLAEMRKLHDQARAAREKRFAAIRELRGDMEQLKKAPEPNPEIKTTRKTRPASERPRRRSRSRDGPEPGR